MMLLEQRSLVGLHGGIRTHVGISCKDRLILQRSVQYFCSCCCHCLFIRSDPVLVSSSIRLLYLLSCTTWSIAGDALNTKVLFVVVWRSSLPYGNQSSSSSSSYDITCSHPALLPPSIIGINDRISTAQGSAFFPQITAALSPPDPIATEQCS
ncbi:uncharacterized protein BP01DRAFT_58249 [Aspergillus saccharolyticus JOP 1030-1]|uniref:Uncharacterized protein n=1 Tax=Aspergillus saccharolyticus JOP 1030-1 TaxID=1450539 RepID=A0A318ZM02_9EURO|nr:hypothetical protein BP01DRAFT_58249 [Aspergillus saccharolyticus JOP 1030-1]PYH44860.1 hypothetical protein BP01DRAFT_58249 [Aspergillus saccharolyticus JOP 1030-1]